MWADWKIGDKTDTQSIQSTASLLYFVSALCGYGAAAFVPSLTLDRPLTLPAPAAASSCKLSRVVEDSHRWQPNSQIRSGNEDSTAQTATTASKGRLSI